jgi:hypothetical protein
MKPRSLASSHTGRRGHDVRHASSTSAYGRGSQPIHSSRSRTKLSTLSDPGMWVISSRRLSSAHYSRYDSGDMNARRPLQAASRRRGGVRGRARRGCRQKLGKRPTAGSRVPLSPVAAKGADAAQDRGAVLVLGKRCSPPRNGFNQGAVCGQMRSVAPACAAGNHAAAAIWPGWRPDSNRRSGVGAAGFEPADLRDPNAALYQTELRPVGASMAAATMHGACRNADAARAWATSLPRLRL